MMRNSKKNLPLQLGPLETLPGRKPLGQHVFENLKQAIIRGDLAPGDRIVETQVAEALDISRTPVREAIHKLEREGLLKKLPKGGFTVMSLSREDIEETFGIRSVLESYAARLAALKHHDDELKPLEEKIKEFKTCLQKGDTDALPKINTEFHNLLYALSRSPKLVRMINDLRDQIFRFRKILLKIDHMPEASNEDHRKMLAAIRKRDVTKVEELVRQHISKGRKTVLKAIGNRPGEL
jgi:DNA-binding GntR family transcriptional regulator